MRVRCINAKSHYDEYFARAYIITEWLLNNIGVEYIAWHWDASLYVVFNSIVAVEDVVAFKLKFGI